MILRENSAARLPSTNTLYRSTAPANTSNVCTVAVPAVLNGHLLLCESVSVQPVGLVLNSDIGVGKLNAPQTKSALLSATQITFYR